MKEKLIFLSAHLPSETYPQAGHKIAFKNLKDLSEKYEVSLITFANRKELNSFNKSDFNFCADVYCIYLSTLRKLFNFLLHPFWPVKISIRNDHRVKKILKKCDRTGNYHFEYTEMVSYLPERNRYKNITVTAHDILYQSVDRKRRNAKNILVKSFWNIQYKLQKIWEKDKLGRVSEVVVLSDKDKMLLNEINITEKIRIDFPAIDEKYRNVERTNIENNTMLFVGAMDRWENLDGIIWFINDVLPKLEKLQSDYKLYIVGSNPGKKLMQLSSGKIIVTGFVDDLLQFYRKCHVAIAPLREGAGVKIKVLEALTANMNVIATPVGAEGIIHKNLYVASSEQQFAEALFREFNSSSIKNVNVI